MDNYKTPKWIFDLFEGYFDPCPLDPSPLVDGLDLEWGAKNFVNPPYSNPLIWVKKAIKENKKGKKIILLLKLDCSTQWFRLLMNANAHILFINERVKFNGHAPPFCNALFILD